MFSVREIARLVDGELFRGRTEAPARVIHDSRLVRPGDLFIALTGRRVDGRAFLADAFERGACGALAPRPVSIPDNARNVIAVENPVVALHRLATAWRDALSATFVAITGTNGKTTVKDLLGHMLAGQALTYVSPHSYNTEVGLPVALLSMPVDAQFGVFELGAERMGDIAALAAIVRPDWGVVTSVGPGHLDQLGSLDAVATEKWSLIAQLPEDGGAVIWAGSPQLLARAPTSHVPILAVGLTDSDIQGRIVRAVPDLEIALDPLDITLRCSLVGAHNAANLLLAAATAHALGVGWDTISERAGSFKPIPQRLHAIAVPFGTILDDSYNANPASTEAALQVLAEYGPDNAVRTFVFGSMLGLGDRTSAYHRQIAQLALSLPIDAILPIGEAASTACRTLDDPRVFHVPREEIASRVRALGHPAVVLVKGSRALELETLVDQLRVDALPA